MRGIFSVSAVVSSLTFMSLAIPTQASAQGTLIPVTTRRDMIFDHAGKYLYITTSDGLVEPYNLASGQLETAYNLGGSLNGLDISDDDSFLLVAQNETGVAQGVFEKLDLSTGAITNINYPLAFYEGGGLDVAMASNGLAFVTTIFEGSGWTPLRQIDLATNEVSERTDAPGSGGPGMVDYTAIYRSADRTRLYFLEGNISSGPVFTYSAKTDTFGPVVDTNAFTNNGDAGINRDGTLLGTRLYSAGLSLDTAPEFNFVHTFNAIDGGIAFNAVEDILYGVDSLTDEIIGYDTSSFAEKFRRPIGEDVGDTRGVVTELVASQDGRYLALATSSGVRLIPTVATGTAALANISTRLAVQTGDDVLIGGFIIAGQQAKTVAIRAIGPSLADSGLANPLVNPVLELHRGADNTIIATNDDWQSANNANDIPEALQPTDSRESVILITLQPGAYTAIVSGSEGTTGVGLVEVYNLDSAVDSRLANVSTRGFVQTGDDVMIGGVITQNGDGIAEFVIRAIGPSLSDAGIANPLADPVLELHDTNGALIETNDNWKDSQQAAIEDSGLAPSNDLESAIIATVAAGSYTAIVRGAEDSEGVGLVEVYNL